ncbi:sensor histidine kinase [Bacillus sp. JJ1521]|uniref:sensor histidine kinase n=1 Tax=Bacillus sp. JJ1521 TaxID=3122957 RepID=UPI003000B2DF
MSSKREIVGAQILMNNRDLAITSGESIVMGDYKKSNEYIKAIGRPGTVYWSGTIENNSPSMLYQHITPLSRMMYDDKTGDIMGTLVLALKEFALADTYSYIDLGPSGFVFIMDRKGEVVSHLNKNLLSTKADYPFVESIINASESDNRTFPTYIDNEKYLISYSKSEVTGWYVVSAIPYSYLMEDILKVKTYSVQLAILLFVLSLIVSLLISTGISKPIQKLVTAMKQVEQGNFNVSVKNLNSSNEINHLGKTFNQMIRYINDLIDQVYEAEILQKEAEIKALQSQINPHFLYNTLSTIDSIATVKQEKEISEISQMLADIFRYSTNGNDFATLEEELLQIERYLNIQKFRYGQKLNWRIIVDPTIKSSMIVKLLLQPIVENAVIHGIRKSGMITISAYPQAANLSIVIEDNGIGMDDLKLEQLISHLNSEYETRNKVKGGDHIGLVNVNNRIKSHFGNSFGLKIISAKEIGTKVNITLPVLEKNDHVQ